MHRVAFSLFLLSVLLAHPFSLAANDGSTQLSITAHAEREVANDLMTAQLTLERRSPDAAQATAEVNRVMRSALDRLEHIPAVEARSLGYTTSPVYARDQSSVEAIAWQVRQVLELKSRDFELLTPLVGELQEMGLAVSQILFSISPESRAQHRQELLVDAVRQWQRTAQEMGAALGASHIFPTQLTLHDDGFPIPRPMMAMGRMDEMASAPALEAGRSVLRVTVSGDARAYGAATMRTIERR